MRFIALCAAALLAAQGIVWAQQGEFRLAERPSVIIDSTGAISVKSFGAVGDGVKDDSASFQRALDAAREQGRPLQVPPGTYRIARGINITQQTMIGAVAGVWVADAMSMPKLVLETMDEPAITLGAGGGIHGFHIEYNWQGEKPSPRGPAILLTGVGPRITDLKIHNVWDGILADGINNVGRTFINSVFMVDVHNVGIRMMGTWDVSWISRVEIWSPSSENFPARGVGVLIGKNDMLLMDNVFVFRADIAYKFVESVPDTKIVGGMWGSLSNCTADFSGTAIQVEGEHTISFSGGTYWTHHHGIIVDGKQAQVRMSGLELKSNSSPTVDIKDCRMFVMSGCQIRRDMDRFTAPAVRISGGEAVVISGNGISSVTEALEYPTDNPDFVVTGNVVKNNYRPDPIVPNDAPPAQ